jgi:pimeloyl-ACP methyl ester carboxylesterase
MAEDRTELFGWYVPPMDGKTAVLRHGAGSTASDVLPQARVLLDNGYGVLLTDARGHGSSGGTSMDFGWHGDADIAAAIDFLTTQPEVDPDRIVVVGLSMGGEEAIGALAADGRIAAVVAEGATARTEADKAWLADAYGWRGWVQIKLEWAQYTLASLLTTATKPASLAESAAGAWPRPILMVAAGKVDAETDAARHIQTAARGNVAIWAVPEADHIGGLAVAPEQWEETVITFLDSAIGE